MIKIGGILNFKGPVILNLFQDHTMLNIRSRNKFEMTKNWVLLL